VGDVLASWLSACTRQASFVTLRALGTTSTQVARVLTWEQIIVSVAGLLLGVGFSVLLIVSVIPSLTFTDLNANLGSTQFFALQSALPTRIVVPPSLPLVLLIYAGIVVVAIAIMVRVAARPALDRALRLDES
jgi:ABC-type antimicrobial peptide transport system permease subunit